MATFIFPIEDPDLAGISSYSPLDSVRCPAKPFGKVSAEEYLEFARTDLSRRDSSSLIDSLSNANRCLHYQTEKLLYRFGLREATVKLNFPEKLDLLRELRIVSGTLLRLFNRERNLMEHEYQAPTTETAEGAIDLCELYLLATDRFLMEVPARIRVVMSNDTRDVILVLGPGDSKIQKLLVKGSTAEKLEHGIIYSKAIFEFGSDEINKTLRIEKLSEIPITLGNKEDWLQILRIFTATVRPSKGSDYYPKEPLVVIEHSIPWEVAKKAFTALGAKTLT